MDTLPKDTSSRLLPDLLRTVIVLYSIFKLYDQIQVFKNSTLRTELVISLMYCSYSLILISFMRFYSIKMSMVMSMEKSLDSIQKTYYYYNRLVNFLYLL